MSGLRSFAGAVSYFTIVPVRSATGAPDRGALGWLPFVGALIGATTGGAGWLAWHFAGAPWSFVVPFVLAIVLTGAIHLDGFMDCCDALLASTSADRRRAILKDPRHGTYAVAGAIILAAIWLAALSRFPYGLFGGWGSVGVMAAISTFVRMAVIANLDGSRRPGLASVYGVLAAPGTLAMFGLKRWATGRLGGAESGDIYGASVVILEVAALVALSLAG